MIRSTPAQETFLKMPFPPHPAEPDPSPPGSLQGPATGLRSGSQRGLWTTNSVDRIGAPLTPRRRYDASPALQGPQDAADFSVIAVYSREAFLNFGKTWRRRMEGDLLERPIRRPRPEDESVVRSYIARQRTFVSPGSDLEAQLDHLIDGKTIPHVIAVIEGSSTLNALKTGHTLGGKRVLIPYLQKKIQLGLDARGNRDDKQNFSLYVRRDLENVYRFTDEKINHPKGEAIRCVGVNYVTADGTQYRSLIVHIPNAYVGSQADNLETHKAFQDYADGCAIPKEDGSPPVIVTGYLGDTNYSRPIQEYSAPSMGGILHDGQTLHPQSSGAQHETNFMQSVALTPKDVAKHRVKQPSTLNYVFVNPDAASRAATDHPSIEHFIAHQAPIVGRNPDAIPEYYSTVGNSSL